ncbi:hypothetical protein [Gracilibacillus sp. YIM 98692]|uniref:hypothetical protein n=1 Tax=Gracilibacillus sp. YIM 98692 TaxID=2663532 RepID=UPI0013D70C29|nr:hypothetical protein [Gracilibacillus sp. YIM 98692]
MVFITLAVLLVVFFVLLMGVGGKQLNKFNDEEGEVVIRQVYYYAVAFITLVMVIGGGVFAFMAVADYVSPNTYIETFEEYKNMREHQPKVENSEDETEDVSEEELRRQYDAMVEQRTESNKQRALNSFVKSLGWIIIPLPIFIFFQRRINREKGNK